MVGFAILPSTPLANSHLSRRSVNAGVIWLKDLLKYRLSTALLLTTIVAISLGWWIDHTSRNRRDIVGTWYYPTGDFIQLGYTTTLEIRADGTFTKEQKLSLIHI